MRREGGRDEAVGTYSTQDHLHKQVVSDMPSRSLVRLGTCPWYTLPSTRLGKHGLHVHRRKREHGVMSFLAHSSMAPWPRVLGMGIGGRIESTQTTTVGALRAAWVAVARCLTLADDVS